MSKLGSRFQRGSGVYKCNCCGRGTRATGHNDNEHVGLCVQCYELAGMDNQLTDMGEVCTVTVKAYFADLAAKGIDAAPLFPELAAALAVAS